MVQRQVRGPGSGDRLVMPILNAAQTALAEKFRFHAPTVPCTFIDLINRRAAATGSIGYAQQTAWASYNGHHSTVYFNDYRNYWLAEHFWSGRVVYARGEFRNAARAAWDEYARGAKGACVSGYAFTQEDFDFALSLGFVAGEEPKGEIDERVGCIENALRSNTTHLLIQAKTSAEYWELCQREPGRGIPRDMVISGDV